MGKTKTNTANGEADRDIYYINLTLPNNVTVNNILAIGADLEDGIDLLIGMDIITQGDFSITNVDGVTIFSFRMPSISKIDYVEELENIHQSLKEQVADLRSVLRS